MLTKTVEALLDQPTAGHGRINLQFLTGARSSVSFAGARSSAAPLPDGAKQRQPAFYLDANIMVDALKSRNFSSVKLVRMIDENGWACVTSVLAFMEMIDTGQDHAYAKARYLAGDDYAKICRSRQSRDMSLSDLKSTEADFHNFYQQYPFICPASLDVAGWDLSLYISSSSNIFAPDVIHLATAWTHGCDLLITNDSHFVKESKRLLDHENISRFAVCTAEEVEKTMQKLGFEVTV